MMQRFNQIPLSIKIFLLLLTIVNVLQAAFTELLPDEAYYYMYSTRLAFGYFDHPPLIALLIKIGEYFTHSQLGVRLICVLLNSATAYILYIICNPKNALFFICCYLNFIAFQALGFLAVPDVPLMFFAACFFLAYSHFLKKESLRNMLWLSVCAAALIYSKYHGFLVIGFVVLSNMRLFVNVRFYVIILGALLLLSPHILWQLHNDFPSIKYHLGYRFDGGISLENIFGYIGGQLAFIGPIAVFCLCKSSYKLTSNKFEKANIFTALGFLIFFLVSSFNGRVEANWTAAAFIPFIILVNNVAPEINFKLVKYAAITITFLILPLRIYLVYDFLPPSINYQQKRHGWKMWADNVKQKANGAVLVFQDSYQKTAMYSFYANEFAHSVNSFGCRKSQYDLWPDYEEKIQGKTALVIPNWVNNSFDSIPTPVDEKMCCILIPNYRSYTKLHFKSAYQKYQITAGKMLSIKINATAPQYVYHTLDVNKELIAYLSFRIFYMEKDSFSDHVSSVLVKPYLKANGHYTNYDFTQNTFEKGNYKIVFYARVGTTESGTCAPIEVEVR